MIKLILQRRLWIIRNRLFSTFGLLFLLPVFLHIIINLPLKRLVINPLWNVSHEQWIFPGLVIIVSFIMMIPIIYRDLFDLRLHNKLLPSLVLAPVSKANFLYSFILAAIIESTFYAVVIMWIFSLIMIPEFSFIDFLIMFPFIILFIGIGTNILISLSLIIDKTTLFVIMVLAFFIFVIFGSGLIVQFEFFPAIIGDILRYLPTGQIMQALRMAIFSHTYNWPIIFLALFSILLWAYFNGLIFTRRIHK